MSHYSNEDYGAVSVKTLQPRCHIHVYWVPLDHDDDDDDDDDDDEEEED